MGSWLKSYLIYWSRKALDLAVWFESLRELWSFNSHVWPLEWRRMRWKQVPLKKDPVIHPYILPPGLRLRDLWRVGRVPTQWGRGNPDIFRITRHCCCTDKFLETPEIALWFNNQRRDFFLGQVIWLGQSHSGLSMSIILPCGYFPGSEMHNWYRHIEQQAKSLHWFSDQWSKGSYGVKHKMAFDKVYSK